MPRYKLTIAYDGTSYCGWQVQPNGTSIQSLVQKALGIALRAPTDCTGSGRTDAGVHAEGQTAHFDSERSIDPLRLRLTLNALLPLDIRIFDVTETKTDFHARYTAASKIYHYHLHLDRVSNPFVHLYRYQVHGSCDLRKIQKAIPYFLGTHDFLSFANQPDRGSASRDSIRTLMKLDLVEQKGGIRLEFEADGFLYKMVRNITGTLLKVGAGTLEPDEIPRIFAAKDRKAAPDTASPKGLFLMQVIYSDSDRMGIYPKDTCSNEG